MPLQLRLIPEPPSTFRQSGRPQQSFDLYRSSLLPRGGWTQETFQSSKGKKLLRDILAARRLGIRENTAKLTKSLVAMFEEEQEAVLVEFVKLVRKHNKKTIGSSLITLVLDLTVPDGSESLWEAALNRIFNDGSIAGRVLKVFRPSYHSTLTHIVNKTTQVLVHTTGKPKPKDEIEVELGSEVTPVTAIEIKPETRLKPTRRPSKAQMSKLINRKADNLATKVTRIGYTTRKRMRLFFKKNIEAGTPIREVIERMREEFPRLRERASRIVRNELSVAANEAQILSFQNSRVVTHCSVVGCQGVEPDSPTYNGFHTCNIRNVPVQALELVDFHIGHTGSWVPSGFYNKDGSVPSLPLGNTEGIGRFDDPEAPRNRPGRSRT